MRPKPLGSNDRRRAKAGLEPVAPSGGKAGGDRVGICADSVDQLEEKRGAPY